MKNILLLIGPKGSGKSFIGSLLEKEFGIKFVRVEDWAKNIKRERNINDDGYLTEVFQVIEEGIRKALKDRDTICFESLALSDPFDRMVNNLVKDFKLITIKILCDLENCIERIQLRDQSQQIIISESQIREVNRMVTERDYKTNYKILNNTSDKDYLVEELKKILTESKVPIRSQIIKPTK